MSVLFNLNCEQKSIPSYDPFHKIANTSFNGTSSITAEKQRPIACSTFFDNYSHKTSREINTMDRGRNVQILPDPTFTHIQTSDFLYIPRVRPKITSNRIFGSVSARKNSEYSHWAEQRFKRSTELRENLFSTSQKKPRTFHQPLFPINENQSINDSCEHINELDSRKQPIEKHAISIEQTLDPETFLTYVDSIPGNRLLSKLDVKGLFNQLIQTSYRCECFEDIISPLFVCYFLATKMSRCQDTKSITQTEACQIIQNFLTRAGKQLALEYKTYSVSQGPQLAIFAQSIDQEQVTHTSAWIIHIKVAIAVFRHLLSLKK